MEEFLFLCVHVITTTFCCANFTLHMTVIHKILSYFGEGEVMGSLLEIISLNSQSNSFDEILLLPHQFCCFYFPNNPVCYLVFLHPQQHCLLVDVSSSPATLFVGGCWPTMLSSFEDKGKYSLYNKDISFKYCGSIIGYGFFKHFCLKIF